MSTGAQHRYRRSTRPSLLARKERFAVMRVLFPGDLSDFLVKGVREPSLNQASTPGRGVKFGIPSATQVDAYRGCRVPPIWSRFARQSSAVGSQGMGRVFLSFAFRSGTGWSILGALCPSAGDTYGCLRLPQLCLFFALRAIHRYPSGPLLPAQRTRRG